MRFSRKLQKLLSPELFASAFEHLSRLTHPVNRRRILDTLDRAQFEKLRDQYPYRPGSPRINRFEDVVYWIEINIERAQDLWLDRTPPLRILDLGCGAGYFLYVCRYLGHQGLGLDTDDEPLFRGATDLLGVRRVISKIHPQVPLPDLREKFDLVTAHRVCFHRIDRAADDDWNEWKPPDWKFFIDDVRARFLRPDGRLLLEFNPRRDGSLFFTPELRALFLAQGAHIFRSKALFSVDSKVRPQFKQTGR